MWWLQNLHLLIFSRTLWFIRNAHYSMEISKIHIILIIRKWEWHRIPDLPTILHISNNNKFISHLLCSWDTLHKDFDGYSIEKNCYLMKYYSIFAFQCKDAPHWYWFDCYSQSSIWIGIWWSVDDDWRTPCFAEMPVIGGK